MWIRTPENRSRFSWLRRQKVGGTHYLLATEEEDGDCDAYILKEVETKDEESVYVLVEDDTELSAIGKVFAELLDDADIAF